MSFLRICLFGGFQIAHHPSVKADTKITRSAQGLLAYLLLFRHRIHPREALAGLFWGDHSEERARSCLSTALWRVRRVLEPGSIPKGTYLLTTPTGEIGFNPESDYWLDVAVFEKKVSSVLAKPIQAMEVTDAIAVERSLELCEGELLEGFYDDWALRERERLRALYLKCLAHLMHYHKNQKAVEKSLNLGQRILHYDPLREEIHREMMRLFLEGGHRAMAIRQYQTCCQILKEELGIQPMEETQLLHEQVLKTTKCKSLQPYPEQTPVIPTEDETNSLDHAFQRVRQAMRDLEHAREQLHRTIKDLERLAKDEDFPETK